ncbi:MAG: hypothetical protein AAB853_04040 [Patescibacteria group bacterium]
MLAFEAHIFPRKRSEWLAEEKIQPPIGELYMLFEAIEDFPARIAASLLKALPEFKGERESIHEFLSMLGCMFLCIPNMLLVAPPLLLQRFHLPAESLRREERRLRKPKIEE